MTRAKKSTTSASLQPSKTSHLFASSRKSGERSPVTRERIADDIAKFRKAGGKIEVLGMTRALQRIGTEPANPADPPPPAPAKPTPSRRR